MTANCKTGVASQGHQTQIDSSMNLVFTILSCDIPVELDTIRWYRKYSRNTTKKVVQYLLLRQGPKHVVLVINTTPPYQLCFDCTSCTVLLYESWNFNSGNYLFTTDTKQIHVSKFYCPSKQLPALCTTRCQRCGSRRIPLAAPVVLIVRMERSTA